MASPTTTQEQQLCQFLKNLASENNNRYSDQVANNLLGSLFWCMANGNPQFMDLFFPTVGGPLRGGTLKLREAQGAVNGAEYTEAARGHACGHIFRAGEATYSCKTCGTDDTCCLCSRCFEATDHRGHMVRISVSPGNSGCCDCGDPEAWKTPMFCTIHSAWEDGWAPPESSSSASSKAKGKGVSSTPPELEASIRMTIGRALDFMCDVISCSPEQLRQTKTLESIRQDERMSRLSPTYGGLSSTSEADDCDATPAEEFAVLLWNDEKHTVTDVMHQVARACETTLPIGLKRAYETDEIGRSLLMHSTSIDRLLRAARILEDIKVTVTIRSSRDTFREQMCGTIIEWLGDISGCSVGEDHDILRRVVCEELLRPWRKGSPATHAIVGQNGMDDEELLTQEADTNPVFAHEIGLLRMRQAAQRAAAAAAGNFDGMDDDDEDDDDDDDDAMDAFVDDMDDMDDDDDEEIVVELLAGEAGADGVLPTAQEREALGAALIELLNQRGGGRAGGDTDDMIMEVDFVDGRNQDNANTNEDDGDYNMIVEVSEENDQGGEGSAAGTAAVPTTAPAGSSSTAPQPPPPPPPPPPPHIQPVRSATGRSRTGSSSHHADSTASAAAPAARGSSSRRHRERDVTPSDSDTAEPLIAPTAFAKTGLDIPKTPGNATTGDETEPPNPGRYWLGVPPAYMEVENVPPAEDLFQRVRLDWLILFDLRMWKKLRNNLRSLYITTVVTIPEFKRVLGLRFAGLYTTLAQLYLIGDREPDHSIINISLQMLTTPSITTEIVERGNFLTSLMAILYTFLTTRQVGHPWDVSSSAILAFDSGSVTNRRMYHFFVDLKYLFSSPHVQACLRTEERYMMQFLDLVKLHQGICPNVRAIGEHVEYETGTWISASLITREINRLCRQFSDAFRDLRTDEDVEHLARAIRYAAKTVILSSVGAERLRFSQAEIREEVQFRTLSDFEFDGPAVFYDVVRFVVEEQPISFHHALHYTLSWLIECGKSLPLEHLRSFLSFTAQELKAPPRSMGRKLISRHPLLNAEDYLMAAFDYPLRVCAWLAQMKAGMWVRNGISLRHQAGTYRGVSQRDVAHQRDIFLLQTALVVCNPSRVLVSILDRFGMERWVKGIFEQKAEAQDDAQHLDVVEDMVHLLIVLVSDRTALVDDQQTDDLALRRDIVHVLCFKPLSYTDICNKLPDRFQEQENFQTVLESMATYKAPDGNADVGTFELLPQYIEEVDPYSAHYNKNQREESETAYRQWMAKKTGQSAEAVVYEPRLQTIASGAFVGLADFTGTGVFAQLVYYSLLYPLVAEKLTPTVPLTRLETFLQVVLHLVLIAIAEDKTVGEGNPGASGDENEASFIRFALNQQARSNFMPEAPEAKTIVALLEKLSTKDELKACHAKIALILKRMRQKRPAEFTRAYVRLGMSVDRLGTASPAYDSTNASEERERKKRAAMDRQARVMAQFQEQQKSFLANQGDIDWGDVDDEDDEDGQDDAMDATAAPEQKKTWKYPAGTCILCQEETDDRRLHGTFAFFTESLILRQTDLQDADFVREAAATPRNLDRSAEAIRPFGVAHENRQTVVKISANGEPFESERQVIGKGFPSQNCRPGVLSVGCGHIMHHHCFEAYFEATLRRHNQQIARHHPEDTDKLEFVCPLCKALGNAFLPIVWKGKEESYPGKLVATTPFSSFLEDQMSSLPFYAIGASRPLDDVQIAQRQYIETAMQGTVFDKASQLLYEAWERLPQSPHALPSVGAAAAGGPLGAAGWPPIPAAMAGAAAAAAAALAAATGGGGGAAAGGAPGTPGAAPGAPSSNTAPPGTRVQSDVANVVRDLVSAYRRLKRTLRNNDLPMLPLLPETRRGRNELYASDTLAQAVGYSIAAVEIQQRGTDAEYGMTLLSKIPEQQLTHLRILCETVTSYIAVGAQRRGGDNRIEREYRRDAERQHCQLFVAQYFGQETETTSRPTEQYTPLLSLDPFVFLCESVFGVVAARKLELTHVLRLCYLAELVKVVYHMSRNIPVSTWLQELMGCLGSNDDASSPLRPFAQFWYSIAHMDLAARSNAASARPSGVIDASLLSADSLGENRGFDQEGVNTLEGYYNFVKKYALVFLRKSAVLMYAHAGVDFNTHVSPAPELGELERLTEALRLPSFDEMCQSLSEGGGAFGGGSGGADNYTSATQQLVNGWVHHYYHHTSTASGKTTATTPSSSTATSTAVTTTTTTPPPPSACLSHPGIYELVGLPQHFEHLLDACTRAHCPTTGKDVSDPMICLLCGAVFCGQAICCLKEERVSGPHGQGNTRRRIGGAQQHMRRCQKNMGLFLNIRKCCIYYLHRMSGSYGHAPYIDKYGEVDLGFRHGRPLELNQRRYDAMLRAVWLSHGVPSFISRKLEMDINNGGWETI
ncbi:E3 ubiquitin-protein ligase ubr1 [Sporothrix bragantina]|uniref:E3 ubiquitin-protein ligase n=1 Tax=Sporothrix bragantina TaxID=671064 RepID=A0ABP0BLA1_9PEZI